MKLVYSMIFIVVLTGCGGGGGGNMDLQPSPPDMVEPPSVDPEIMELLTQLAAARDEIVGIPGTEQLVARIDDLEKSLPTADLETINMLLADILQEIRIIKSPPPPDTPTATECHAQSQILVGDNCQECPPNMQFNENQCVDIPPTATECHADKKILVDDNCQECPPNMQFNENQCVDIPPTAAECHADKKILVDDQCQSCVNQIFVGDRCESCPPNMAAGVNRCVETAATFDTAEYRRNPMYEAIQPLYAYQHGYFGQGVTVAVIEVYADYNVGHPDLAANYITATIDGLFHRRVTAIRDSSQVEDDHSSRVAGVLGAVLDGNGMHGIAPKVKMIPLSSPHRTERIPLANYLRDNIPIVNNSYSSHSGLSVSFLLTAGFAGIRPAAARYNDFYADTDIVFVWGSGNRGFDNPSSNSLYPALFEDLQKNWLVAIAANRNITKASYSNACGEAKDWCVAAVVYQDYTPNHNEETGEYGYASPGLGTSFAAPQVSGALAILYGAIGMDSPQLARAILLTTATDLGDEGVDDIYGWGLVNISAGIKMIESMKSAGTEELSAVSFANLRGELPSGFAHLHNELSAIKLAIKLTTDLYYNVPLSEMLTPGNPKAPPLGDAAAEMLENRGEETRRGIFAYGDINQEIGIRYYGGGKGYSYIAEGTQSATNNFSGNFGGIGGISGKTYNGKLGFTKAIKANMQIFADYERAKIIGKGEAGNIIKGARNARAESWTAGISFGDIWKYGDRIRLSARQEMGLSGGELIIRYPHAVGDFHKTFTGEESQKIEIRETFLPLKQKAKMRYTAGYAQKLNKKSEWATALEYNTGNNDKAISLIWQGEF